MPDSNEEQRAVPDCNGSREQCRTVTGSRDVPNSNEEEGHTPCSWVTPGAHVADRCVHRAPLAEQCPVAPSQALFCRPAMGEGTLASQVEKVLLLFDSLDPSCFPSPLCEVSQ